MHNSVIMALRSIGLSDKEIALFIILLQHGPMYAASVARMAKVNRTTAYGILKELTTKGLVATIHKKGESTRYQSVEPEMLPAFIERRREELAASKTELEKAVPQIQLLRSRSKELPRVRFFEGKRGVEQAYEDMLEHNPNKMIYALTGLEGAVTGGLSEQFMNYFIAKRVSLGISAEYIVPETSIAREATQDDAGKMRVAKFIPPEFDFKTEVCVYDNKVSILSYSLENPVALIIEDDTISHTMKQIFKFIDSKATPS